MNFDIRHGAAVRALPGVRCPTGELLEGKTGKVLAMVMKGERREYLIKWKGMAWPCVVWREDIEAI